MPRVQGYLPPAAYADRGQPIDIDFLESFQANIRRTAATPAGQALLNIISGVTGPSLVYMLGAPGFELVITDSCGILTRGWVGADGTFTLPILAAFMIGGNSDIGVGARSATFVSFSNDATPLAPNDLEGLAQFKFFRFGENRPCCTIYRSGRMAWSDGTANDDVTAGRSAAGTYNITGAGGAVQLQTSDPPVDLDTALLVRRNNAGVFTLVRVTQGAPNSGGAGFRQLLVPN